MNAFLALARHDARLQFRYGIYLAYAFVLALYVAFLTGLGSLLPPWVAAVIVFSDPAALGFFFLGALMMLERSERVRSALAVTPLSPAAYVAAKAVTLTAMALVACAALGLALGEAADLPLLLGTVALTSLQYVGIGVPVALRFRTVTGYLVGAGALLTPLIAPGFLALLDPMPLWLAVVPAISQMRLMLIATGAATADPLGLAVMLAVSAVAAAGALWFAVSDLTREFAR
jgi:fluoroquinolone transport system permease protein